MPDYVALTSADLEWLLAADPDNHPEVAYWIAYCHHEGTGGVQENNHRAVLHFEKAAKHNHAKALWHLAACYHNGWVVSMDTTQATELFQKANAALPSALQEDRNDAEAQNLLGLSHDNGFGGLNVDKARAFSLYQQAAQQGHVEGQWNIGLCLEEGLDGVTKDCVQAAGWYGQAARQGHSYARTHFDKLFEEKAEVKEELAEVARNGARDQQETFLAASALAHYWTPAQQWQAIADQCTKKVPPSWKPRILRVAPNPLGKLQKIQKSDDTTARQEQLVAFVKELLAYCNSSSEDSPEVFRVLGYCHDHGIGMEREDPEQAFRLYVKADKLVGIISAAGEVQQGTNTRTETTAATTETRCSSAEWLYNRLEDERVTCYETHFQLNEVLASLRTAVQEAKLSAFDSATLRQAIRKQLELEFLQGLLHMDRFTSEAELEEKARSLDHQVRTMDDLAERLRVVDEMEGVQAQLKKEVMAREAAEHQRRQGAAPLPPSAPAEEDLPPDAYAPHFRSRWLQ